MDEGKMVVGTGIGNCKGLATSQELSFKKWGGDVRIALPLPLQTGISTHSTSPWPISTSPSLLPLILHLPYRHRPIPAHSLPLLTIDSAEHLLQHATRARHVLSTVSMQLQCLGDHSFNIAHSTCRCFGRSHSRLLRSLRHSRLWLRHIQNTSSTSYYIAPIQSTALTININGRSTPLDSMWLHLVAVTAGVTELYSSKPQ